jgi:hypothetical protein
MTPTPEPRELWERAGRDPERYRELLREHGALVDVEPCASCGERFRHRHSRAGAIVRVDVFGHDELRRRDG